MRRVSAIIPHYPAVPGAPEALQNCIKSLKGHAELVVVVNDGIGYAKAVNIGLSIATGDYICIINNDTILLSGDLQMLASWDGVTVPAVYPESRDTLPRSFFCLPHWVITAFGGTVFDERFEGGYFEDDDFHRRLDEQNIEVLFRPEVKVYHQDGGGLTMKFMGEQENFDKNKKVYEDKWA